MDNGGTEEGSVYDAVLECPALPSPHTCLPANAEWIGFLRICFFRAFWRFVVVLI
jgi:hypothetical protein